MSKLKDQLTRKEKEDHLRQNPINAFTCCGKTMTFDEFKKHLSEVHKLSTDQMKGRKSMLAHIDGDYWFSSSYQWELESGLKFTQYVEMARNKNSLMY